MHESGNACEAKRERKKNYRSRCGKVRADILAVDCKVFSTKVSAKKVRRSSKLCEIARGAHKMRKFETGKVLLFGENADFPPKRKSKMEDDGGKLLVKK